MKEPDYLNKLKALKPDWPHMNISRLAVFGSRADGTATDNSDLDLLIEFRKTPDFFEFVRVKQYFEDYLGLPVDLVTFHALKTPRQKKLMESAIDV